MKTCILFIFIIALCTAGNANGVGIIDAKNGIYLTLLSSQVEVTVENQVALVTTTQVFNNRTAAQQLIKYGFPLPEGASGTELLWKINSTWYQAKFAPTPQDTSQPGPGGEIHPNLKEYLGETPLYFNIEQKLKADSLLIVKLSYVQLLPYSFGKVEFSYPNDYHLIQTIPLNIQELNFNLYSERTIDNIQLLSHTASEFSNDGHTAHIGSGLYELTADTDYRLQYTLSSSELGLFSLSTAITDTLVPDEYGNGFFVFIAEPDPSAGADVIAKVFTLIIDRSGSMASESKMSQAKNAASFIIQNLNPGDKFNIIDFSTAVSSFRATHVDFTEQNKTDALAYISALQANGLTNISGAFDLAISQFGAASNSTANIIIFFTDGQPTTGITDIQGILSEVTAQIQQNETKVIIFTFGVGSDVNQQLLTLLATQHLGLAEFLGTSELEARITEFYLKIRNPVLLNTQMTFSSTTISETYPSPLPNLYKGQQLLVAGRYLEPEPVSVTFSGEAFGQPVTYQYNLNLQDSILDKYQFLTKVWAKKKIEYLLIQYYSLDPESVQAKAIKTQIVDLSLSYAVLSPFTSLSGGEPVYIEQDETLPAAGHTPQKYTLFGNYPNPFNPGTTIMFQINEKFSGIVLIKIYDVLGRLVRVLSVSVNGPGLYQVHWDGTYENGLAVASGMYLYIVDFGDGLLAGKMNLLK
jgi:Ca-activated chloride channel family protein